MFHKDNVIEFLNSQKPTEEQKKGMEQLLLENQQLLKESDYDIHQIDRYEDLLYRIENMELSYADINKLLSIEELADFRNFIKSGDVDAYFEVWTPWWNRNTSDFKIQPIDEDMTEISEPPFPEIMKDIPSFESLTKISPSPFVVYNLLDILYAYCYTACLYNGDLNSDIEGIISSIMNISGVLALNKVHTSSSEAVKYCIEKSLTIETKVSQAFSEKIIKDIYDILEKGSEYCLMALSDLQRIFVSSKKRGTKLLSHVIKKIFFYLAWTNEMVESDIFRLIAIEIQMSFPFMWELGTK